MPRRHHLTAQAFAVPVLVGMLVVAAVVWPAIRDAAGWVADTWQWDLRVYRAAVLAWRAGLDPYQTPNLWSFDPTLPHDLGWVYPPAALWLMAPLTWLPLWLVGGLWLAGQAAVLGYLTHLLGPMRRTAASGLLMLLGLGGTVWTNLQSGNLALFETAGLWWAFAALLTGRRMAFAIAIGAVSWVKLTPFAFLTLLALVPASAEKETRRDAVGPVLAGSCAFLLPHLLGALFAPDLVAEWWAKAGALDERGPLNPSLLAMLRDLCAGLGWGSTVAMGLYGGLVWTALQATLRVVRQMRRAGIGSSYEATLVVMTVVAAYVVVAPRFKDYSAALLLPAAALAVEWEGWRPRVLSAFLVWLCCAPLAVMPGLGAAWRWVLGAGYLGWWTAVAIWLVLLTELDMMREG